MEEKLDAIIFGATGYTGKIVVEDALDMLKDLKWGIAGRNEVKLKGLLKDLGNKVQRDLSYIPTILADVNNEASIDNMAKQCKVVINCCGPYRFYGEVVVQACVAAGIHHLDISVEPQFIAKMQLKYNDLAQERGSYIISSCGFECIPAEMGILYAENNFSGTINSIEMYFEMELNLQDKSSKAIMHAGTWNSLVYALQYARELFRYQNKLNRENMPRLTPRLWLNPFPHKTEGLDSYFIPLPECDRAVIQRSQRMRYMQEKKRPIQFEKYAGCKSLILCLLFPIYILNIAIMAQFKFTRSLLFGYPKFFTYGLISADGPVEANKKALKFCLTFKANGWSKESQISSAIDKELVVKVSAKDGYAVTSNALLACARVVLKENQKMPGSGGVLPPGMAFAKTQLLEELSRCKSGLKFEIVKK